MAHIPNKCISSITSNDTALTYFRVCQLRLTPSHFSGVVTITSAFPMALMSGITSPVNSMTLWDEDRKLLLLLYLVSWKKKNSSRSCLKKSFRITFTNMFLWCVLAGQAVKCTRLKLWQLFYCY